MSCGEGGCSNCKFKDECEPETREARRMVAEAASKMDEMLRAETPNFMLAYLAVLDLLGFYMTAFKDEERGPAVDALHAALSRVDWMSMAVQRMPPPQDHGTN